MLKSEVVETVLKSVLSGICIAIAGTVSMLTRSNPIISAILFTVGLFIICVNKLYLFTGKICYAGSSTNSPLWYFLIWIGNFFGATLTALALYTTRLGEQLLSISATVCNAKMSGGLWSAFILAILCNMLIYVAVDGFQNSKDSVGKYLALFLVLPYL